MLFITLSATTKRCPPEEGKVIAQAIPKTEDNAMETKEIAGRFVIEREIARRPNCVVYAAKDRTLQDRLVAVKTFVDEPGNDAATIKEFEDEIALLRKASHQALIPILAGGCDNGKFYIAMELVEDGTLRDMLKAKLRTFSVDDAVALVRTLAEAVGEIHDEGGTHGHIDSRSVLFKGDKPRLGGYCPRAIDKLLKNLTTQGRLTVDPVYISPEQVSGSPVDGRADIFALAVLLYELTTGERPFDAGNPLQTAMLRISANPIPPARKNSDLSPLLDAAILKGLAKDPNARFASIADFIDAITGGKAEVKNPFVQGGVPNKPERLGVGETVGVSMSLDAIKGMLKTQESSSPKPLSGSAATEGEGTMRASSAKLMGEPVAEAMQTAVGMKATGALSGSLMIVEGSGRGQKYVLDKPQIIIGSDGACDIVASGKEVSRRHAIIVKKGESYSVEPLSSHGVIVNGAAVEADTEHALKRGDALSVGAIKLRFIAPGEVFTLHDKVADRVIDRPESKARKIVMLATVFCLAVVAGLLFVFSNMREDQKSLAQKQAAAKARKQSTLIATLQKEGDQFFKDGSLIEPVGANAKERFEQILEINPDDTYAKRRIAEITERSQDLLEKQRQRGQVLQQVEKLLADADKHFQAKEYIAPLGNNAREIYSRVLELDSGNTVAKNRLEEINTIMSGMFHKVETYLAKASVYKDLGQYVLPKDENAYNEIKDVLALDPSNEVAKDMLLDMAAASIYEGDIARKGGEVTAMKKAYLVAQLLGVDPQYLEPRLKGLELMTKSKASVVIYDRKDSNKVEDSKDSRFLSRQELEKRLASLSMQADQNGDIGGQRFYDLSQRR